MKKILRITWKEFSYGIRSFPFWFIAIGLAVLMLGDSLPDFYAVASPVCRFHWADFTT